MINVSRPKRDFVLLDEIDNRQFNLVVLGIRIQFKNSVFEKKFNFHLV